MQNKGKTKEQLFRQVVTLRQRVAELETQAQERNQTDERLQLPSSAIEQSTEGIAVSDLEGNLLFTSVAFAAMHGYRPEELVGKHLSIFHTLEQMPDVDTANQQIQETGEFSGEIWHVRRDGTVFPALMHNWILRDATGNPTHMIGTALDITSHKQAEKAQGQHAARLALLNDIGSKITAVLELDSLLNRAVYLVQESFGYHHVALFIMDHDRNELTMRARAGKFTALFPLDHRLKPDQGMVGWVARHGETLLANDVTTESRYVNLYPDIIPTQAELSVPIRLGETVEGVLDVQSPHLNAFDQNDVMVMETLADQIAVAIENARLYESIQQELAERKQAQEALRESEAKYRALTDNSPNGIFVSDAERFIYVNRRLGQITGFSEDDLLNMSDPVQTLFAPEEQERLQAYAQRRLDGDQSLPISYEVHGIRKDGEDVWLRFTVSSIILSGKKMLQGTVENITERKQLEQQIEERRLYLESVLAYAPDAIVTLNAQHHIVEWNPGAETLFGYSSEEAFGRDIDELIAAPDARIFEQAIRFTQQAFSGEPVPPTVTVRYRKDGTPVDVIMGGAPIIIEEELVGIVAVYTDITERKQAEEALKRSEAQYRNTIDSMGDAVHVIDQDLNIILFNETFRKWSAELDLEQDTVGKKLDEVFPSLPSHIYDEYDTVFKTGQLLVTEESTHLGSREFITDTRKIPILEDGQVVQVITVIRDITERKQAEEAAQAAEREKETILDSLVEHVVHQNTEMKILWANQAACQSVAMTREELVGRFCYEIWLQNRQPCSDCPVVKAMETGQPQEIEKTTPDGKSWYIRGYPVRDEQNTIVGGVEITLDITGQMQAEEVLRVQRDLAVELSLTNDLKEALHRTLETACQLEGLDCGGMYLADPFSGELDLIVHQGLPRQFIESASHYTHDAPQTQIVMTGEPLYQIYSQVLPNKKAQVREQEGLRAIAIVPITYEGQSIGALNVASHTQDEISVGTRTMLESIAAQIGGVIARIRAEAETLQRTAQLEALRKVGLDLAAQLDLNTLLHSIVSRAVQLLESTAGGLYLYRPEQDVLEWVMAVGTSQVPIGSIVHRGEGLSGKIWQTGEPLIVNDYHHWEERAVIHRDDPWTAIVGAPIRWRGEFLGVVIVERDKTGTFSSTDAELLSLFAGQAATAIENARLFEAEARRRREAETLQAATQALSATLDLQQVFELILIELGQVVPYDSATVQQLKGEELEIIWGCGFPHLDTLLGVSFDLTARDNPNREVVRTRAPFILNDAPAIYEEFKREPHAQVVVRAWLGVPLLFGDRLTGMITLDKKEPGFYTDDHARLAMAYAAQAAIAIENARLFQETQQRLKELTLLFETSTEVSTSLNVDKVLRTTAHQITTALMVMGCTISLWDRDRDALTSKLDYSLDPHCEELESPGTGHRLSDYPASRQVLIERQPLTIQVNDPDADPAEVAWMKNNGVQSLLMLPLVARDEAIGLLEVQETHQEREFTPTEISLCQTLANHAAAALENARLFQAEREQRELTEALRLATAAIGSTLDVDLLLDQILEQVDRVIPGDAFSIMLIENDQAHIVRWHGYDQFGGGDHLAAVSFPVADTTTLRQMYQTRTPVIVASTQTHGDWTDVSEWVRSYAGAPIRVRDKIIGFLNANSATPNFFDLDHAGRLQTFADQAGLAIENARLFEAEREQRELAEALRQATAAVSSTLDLDQVWDLILEQLSRVIPNDACNVMLIENDQAFVVRWRGYERFGDQEDIQAITFHLPETPSLRHIQETGAPLVISNTTAYDEWIDLPETRWLRSVATAPIRIQEQVIGFLNVDSATPGFFRQDHVDRLRAFADQVSLALANAQLFHTVEEGKRDWEATFDAMQDAIVLLDRSHHIVRANRTFAHLVQKDLPQLVGQIHHAVLDSMVCPETVCPLEQTIENAQPARCVHEYHKQIFEIQTTPVPESGKTPDSAAHAIYVMRDVTERKLAEEEVHRRNRELALLNRIIAASATNQQIETILETVCRELALAFDASTAFATLLDPEETDAVVVAEHLVAGRSSILGQTIPAANTAIIQHMQRHKTPLAIQDTRTDLHLASVQDLIRKLGVASVLIIPLIIEGKVIGSLSLATDEPRAFSPDEATLAERVAGQISGALARARLEETQRRLSTAVEQAAEAVIITNTEGIVLYVNPAFEQITGYTHAEFIGQNLRHLSSEDQIIAPNGEMWRIVTAGQTWQGQFSSGKANGGTYTVDSTVTPVRNQAGETVNYVATLRDVTREVQLEEQFRQAQKMEALGRLAGGVAHDFNNLLTVIHLSTRLLQRQLHSADPLWEHVERIREAGERATKLTKQLLSFSRREVVEPEVLNLNQVVTDLIRMLQRIIGEDVELMTTLADDLWLTKADPSQIEQAILNLAVNARDAMPEGGRLTIETTNVILDEAYVATHVDAQLGEHVMLAVSDTGIGMDEEVKTHLFEPFFTTKKRGEGTGLGLPTVFGVVKLHGGHIWVDSIVGQGATFKIYLPRTKEVKPSKAADPSLSAVPHLVHGTETVLLVEDEDAVRRLAVSVLKSCGYQVLAARGGPEALELSDQYRGPIHLLLTDVVMPQMSGRELAERLREQRPKMQIVYMSGYTDEAIMQHGVRAVGTILSKPFTIEALTQKVRAVLDNKE